MSALSGLDSLLRQGRLRHARVDYCVAALLEPPPKHLHLGGSPHGVGALDDDQLASEIGDVDPGQGVLVKVQCVRASRQVTNPP